MKSSVGYQIQQHSHQTHTRASKTIESTNERTNARARMASNPINFSRSLCRRWLFSWPLDQLVSFRWACATVRECVHVTGSPVHDDGERIIKIQTTRIIIIETYWHMHEMCVFVWARRYIMACTRCCIQKYSVHSVRYIWPPMAAAVPPNKTHI